MGRHNIYIYTLKKVKDNTAEEDFLPSDELLILLTLLNLHTTLLNTHQAKKVSKTRINLSKHTYFNVLSR